MKNFLLILPLAFLVSYSQIIVKWRSDTAAHKNILSSAGNFLKYLTDPIIISAYASALLAAFAWLYVVTKLPVSVAFPIYIGVTFCFVLLGSWFFLDESMSASKLFAMTLILSGIGLGIRG